MADAIEMARDAIGQRAYFWRIRAKRCVYRRAWKQFTRKTVRLPKMEKQLFPLWTWILRSTEEKTTTKWCAEM